MSDIVLTVPKAFTHECTDVENFAMFIADLTGGLAH